MTTKYAEVDPKLLHALQDASDFRDIDLDVLEADIDAEWSEWTLKKELDSRYGHGSMIMAGLDEAYGNKTY